MVIYKTTNLLNGKIYIGKDERNDPKYLGSGYILKKAINKYGKDNFVKVILEECDNRDVLQERERFWIKELNATDPNIGYNVAEGGSGGNTYIGKSEDELIEIKKKISNAGKGRVFSEEHKRKLSEKAKLRKGNKPCKFKGMKYEDYMSEEHAFFVKEKLRNANLGKQLSEEHKTKIGNSSRGRALGPMSEEHKENLKKSFIERDKKRTQIAQEKNISILNDLLIQGVNEENVNYARRIYQKVRNYGIDMHPYVSLLNKFKEIEFNRRSSRKTERSTT